MTIDWTARRLERYEPIPETGCWLWTGPWNTAGYGKYKRNGRATGLAHRFFYEAHNGPIPAGLNVCHKCDTPPCVNPEHLFLGTTADNALDRKLKGRNNHRGERNGRARLTVEQVHQIRRMSGSHASIARSFGMASRTICDIRHGRRWSHTA